jgi:hypothetical protein
VQPLLFTNLVGGQYYGGNTNGDTIVAKQVLLVVAKTPVIGVYIGGKGSSRQSRPQLTQLFVTPNLNTQSSLILPSHKHVRLSMGRADLSSQSLVVLCYSPLLSTSLTVPLKLSQGPGHSSRHRLAVIIRSRSGSH